MTQQQPDSLETLRKIYQSHSEASLKDYFTFLSFKSISSEAAYEPEVIRCAEWLKSYVEKIGFKCELWETDGHPVLFAEWNEAGPDKPTLLLYNHYDVQPVDPLEEWKSPPFEPNLRDGDVYARGAQDNKGQCFYVLQALKILMEKHKHFPINIKLCIEGEEECGSQGLASILQTHKEQLKANYLAIVDLGIPGPQEPAVTLGIRGIMTLDVEVTGSTTDLHSGSHGGLAYNPIHGLVEILAKLHDESGKIRIPGFYEEITELNTAELGQLAMDFDPLKYETEFGNKPTGGERVYTHLERNWLRPTVEINGVSGGYSGSGFKTVIPAKASAKISCRLVPHQDPEKIANLVASFIESQAPEGLSVKVNIHPGGGKSVRSNPTSKSVQAFAEAFTEVFQTRCKFVLEGASIPVVTELALASESEVVLVGVGLLSDCIHAPNEHFSIDRLEKGALVIARAIELLGTISSSLQHNN
ncbi:MAG: dipeptidase [Parachlamydiaceae bacterium]|nr:dipeptidase [Parachlamydiaceae bacterium]